MMSTVKALAEVLSELVGRVTLSGSGCYSATQVREGYSKRLQDIIAAEAEKGPDYTRLEARVLTQQVEALERRCALQLETIRELRAQLAARDLMTATPEAFGEAAVQGADAHKRYEEELETLFATHRREVAKLKLESDRRARSVAEAVIERVTQIGITERRAIEDINIEAIVDESKL